MQFGLHLTMSERYGPGASMAKTLHEAAYLVGLAREYGFDAVMSDEHILSYPNQRPAPIPALSYLAASAEGMLVGTSVLLLPLHPPVQVAEDIAALDAITNGRAILGVGMGYREEEFAAFGISPKERVGRVYESLKLIRELWDSDEVEFKGKYFNIPRVRPTAKPVQRPHPPIWVGVKVDAAVHRVARNGYAWLIGPGKVMTTLVTQMDMYRKTLREFGHPLPAIQPMRSDVYLAEDVASAWKEAESLFAVHHGVISQWRQNADAAGGFSASKLYEETALNNDAIGTPDQIIEKFERFERELGVNFIDLRLHYVGMPLEAKVRQIRLFGEGVIPHFRKKAAAPVPPLPPLPPVSPVSMAGP